jgi:hypothetical protein
VTDRIVKGDIVVEHCPTMDMISDILTKSLQGSAFRKLRGLLLNMCDDPASNPAEMDHRSVLKHEAMTSRGATTSRVNRVSCETNE